MINRRLFFFRPLATHAEGHLKVTTIVVVVIDIYLYDYYYLNGHSEMSYGPLLSGPAASRATVAVASRARGPGWLCTNIGPGPFGSPVSRSARWAMARSAHTAALSRFRRRSFLFLAPLSRSSQSALWRDPVCRSAQAGARSGGAWGSAMGLQTVDEIEWSLLANIERGERALQSAEDDHHRLEVRDAARAAQVQRAERAIAQANQPVQNGPLWGFETLQACGRA